MARPVLHGAHPRAPRPMLHPARDRHDARQRARRTRNRRRGPYGLGFKRENAKRRACVHSRGRVHARRGRVHAADCSASRSNRRRVFSEKSFQLLFRSRSCPTLTTRAPTSAARRGDGPQAMAPHDLDWMLEMSARHGATSGRRAAQPIGPARLRGGVRVARVARRFDPSAGAGAVPGRHSSSSEVDTSGRDSREGRERYEGRKPVAADTKDKTARATRRPGALRARAPSAVHAELEYTGGDPLHAARAPGCWFRAAPRAIRDPEGRGRRPRGGVQGGARNLKPGRRGDNILPRRGSPLGSCGEDARARTWMESLGAALRGSFSALKTLAASGERVRGRAGARARGAPATSCRTRSGSKKRDSMASVFRREFVSNLAVGMDDAGRWRWRRRAGPDADDEKEGGKNHERSTSRTRAPWRSRTAPRAARRARRRRSSSSSRRACSPRTGARWRTRARRSEAALRKPRWRSPSRTCPSPSAATFLRRNTTPAKF